MAEWLYEAGIGESRAALVEDGRILQARIERPGGLKLGAILEGQLIERVAAGLSRVETAEGPAVIDRVPPGVTLGARLTVEVIREAIPEAGRAKLAKVAASEETPRAADDLSARCQASGFPVRTLRAHESDALEAAGWSEVLDEAEQGEIAFPGGALRMSPTPAMTLFDVDGAGAPAPLAIAAARAAAEAILRLDIGGSIGIDFPTLGNKAERQAAAETIDAVLPQPFERTAVNGFGFLQIVRPRPRASLPETLRADPVATAALALLRAIERTPPPVPAMQPAGPRVAAWLATRPALVAELSRRTGVPISFTS
ncbi:MAG: ribonuclease [Sphingomonas sp.]|uniref:ribonuclease n=1 Tax=Sphingomonas sp. TaxID=28214 RepID=UPI003F7FE046